MFISNTSIIKVWRCFFTAKIDQKFKKYDLDYKLKIINEKQAKASYRELGKKYDISDKTIESWMRILKRDRSLDVAQRGRPTDKGIDYKERYEILKKYQDFLGKKGQKKK